MLLQHIFQALRIVIRHLVEEVAHQLRDALAVGDDLRVLALVLHVLGVGGPHRGVEQAVVGALEGDVVVLAGIAAGEAERRHHRLGAGIGEADQVGRRHHLLDELGDGNFLLGAEREDRADVLPLPGGRIDLRMAMAEDRRAVAQAVVDVFVAVEVPEPGTLAMLHEDRLVLAPEAEVRADAKGRCWTASLKWARDLSSFRRWTLIDIFLLQVSKNTRLQKGAPGCGIRPSIKRFDGGRR